MRVTIKTLQQETFQIEVKDKDTVKHLKEKIANAKGADSYPVESQRLIYSGAILDDSKSLSHYKINESKFIVLMTMKTNTITKQENSKTSAPSTPKQQSTANTVRSGPPPQNPSNPRAGTEVAASAPPSNSSAIENDLVSALSSIDFPPFPGNYPSMSEMLQNVLANTNTSLPFDISDLNLPSDNFSFGPSREDLDALRSEIESYGSLEAYINAALANRDQPPNRVAAALAVRDTSNHMGLSVEDTLSVLMLDPTAPSNDGFSLPDSVPDELSSSSPNSVLDSRPRGNVPEDGVADEYEQLVTNMMAMGFDRNSVVAALDVTLNIPDAAVEYLTTGVLPEMVTNMTGDIESLDGIPVADTLERLGENGSLLAFIQSHPELRAILAEVGTNPDVLPAFLERVATEDPQLLQYISNHQDELLHIINSLPTATNAGAGTPRRGADQSLTEENAHDIAQLMMLGYSEAECIQAYLAFDKNVQMAAEFLLSDDSDE